MKKTFTRFQIQAHILIFLGAGLGSGMLHGQTSRQVAVGNYSFTPKELTITAGDTVVWKNTQGVHNVNGNKSVFPGNPASFGNNLGSNWTYSYVFTKTGVYEYQCDPHIDFGMVGKVTVLPDPNNLLLTVNFTGMNPHVGQSFWLSVSDSGSGEEIVRSLTEARQTFDFKVQGLRQGHSYIVDFYADHNGNGRYDAPPADHAWRLEANNLAGDTQLNFVHNTSFTNIAWKNKLAVSFTGMTPHVGQMFSLYLKDAVSGMYLDTVMLEQLPGAAFQIQSYKIVPGNSYFVDFYADHNQNGQYDAPPADHAWRLNLANVAGDTILNFTHNTIFTDIFPASSSIAIEPVLQDVQLYPNPAGKQITVALKNSGPGLSASVINITGARLMVKEIPEGQDHLVIDLSDYPQGVYFLTLKSLKETRSFRFIRQ